MKPSNPWEDLRRELTSFEGIYALEAAHDQSDRARWQADGVRKCVNFVLLYIRRLEPQ